MTTTLSKKESELKAALRKNREERKKLNREIAATKRRRIAEQRRALEKRNQLLGHAITTLLGPKGLVEFKGRVGASKEKFIHHVKGQPDDTEFRRILACLDEVLAEKANSSKTEEVAPATAESA